MVLGQTREHAPARAGRRTSWCPGCGRLQVRRQLRVGLFSTGNELCEPGNALADGQIWDANRCILRGLLEQLGCEVLRDEPELLEGALSRAAPDCDLLVTSGGMSVGNEDHIRSAGYRALAACHQTWKASRN